MPVDYRMLDMQLPERLGSLARGIRLNMIASGGIRAPQQQNTLASLSQPKTAQPGFDENGKAIDDGSGWIGNAYSSSRANDYEQRIAQAAQAQQEMAMLEKQAKVAKLTRDIQGEQPKAEKLQFSESQGGFIEPPSAQYPQGRMIPLQGAQPKSAVKPLPVTALKLQQEELDAIGAASSLNKDLASFQNMIGKGKLPLGPVNNLGYKIRNMAGQSTEESRNYASFQANLERLRNESLRLNKGVQTEGDAIRAWNEIIANINDPELVMQRLGEVQKVNERGVLLRKMNVDAIRSNYGKDPMDVSARQNLESAYGNQATPNSGGGAQPSNVDALLEKYK